MTNLMMSNDVPDSYCDKCFKSLTLDLVYLDLVLIIKGVYLSCLLSIGIELIGYFFCQWDVFFAL